MPKFDVTIAGELNLDIILYDVPAELPLEREILASGMTVTLGSSSAIVAHNLATLGSSVGFVSCIGSDAFGQIALDRLASAGVDVSHVFRSDDVQTGLSIILQRGSSRTILTYPGTIFSLKKSQLDLGYLSDSKHFHLSSYYLQRGLRPDVPQLFSELKEAGLTISLDCNDDPDDHWGSDIVAALRYVDVFLPNEREARKISGEQDLDAAIDRLSEMVPTLVTKIGSAGAIARRATETFRCLPLKVKSVDAVGAGDSFDAGFLHEFVRGSDLSTCLRRGNLAGALSVTRAGGTEAFRDREYLEAFTREHEGSKIGSKSR